MPNDIVRRSQLRTMRIAATGLLAAMAIVYAVAAFMVPTHPWAGYVRAFSEAAMVGALADWFAVTALFRHPMGVPLPHTAIIKRNKDRIGEGLAGFIEENFLTRGVLETKFAELEPAGIAADWLTAAGNARALAGTISESVPLLINTLNDEDISALLGDSIEHKLHELDAPSLLSGILSFLTRRNRHQDILTSTLFVAEGFFHENEDFIREKVKERVPNLLGFARDTIAAGFARYIVTRTIAVLREVAADPEHPLRRRFDSQVETFINNLRESPPLRARIDRMKTDVVESPVVRQYVASLWDDVKQILLDDLSRKDSAVRSQIENVLVSMGTELKGNTSLRKKVDAWISGWSINFLTEHRHQIAEIISGTIKSWDTETISAKLELQVGRDLQFIRINGTIVGGIVGLGIYFISKLFG